MYKHKIFYFLLAFSFSPFLIFALPASSKSSNDTTKKSTINLNLEYGSNFSYRFHKNDTSHAIPFLYPSITYNARSGFWISAAFFRTFGDKGYSAVPQADFGIGWDFNFKP